MVDIGKYLSCHDSLTFGGVCIVIYWRDLRLGTFEYIHFYEETNVFLQIKGFIWKCLYWISNWWRGRIKSIPPWGYLAVERFDWISGLSLLSFPVLVTWREKEAAVFIGWWNWSMVWTWVVAFTISWPLSLKICSCKYAAQRLKTIHSYFHPKLWFENFFRMWEAFKWKSNVK